MLLHRQTRSTQTTPQTSGQTPALKVRTHLKAGGVIIND
jgi:hypothetical protein